MTSYSIERPARTRGTRTPPRLAHLRVGQATIGQPVTVRRTNADGDVLQEFPAVFVRTERGYLRCQELEHGTYCSYLPSEVFPRRVTYRRWVAAFKRGDDAVLPVNVIARTELEARFEGLKQIKALYGEDASRRLAFHSVKREG